MFKGFSDFIFRGNVVDLAVAVLIGAAFSGIVSALVEDLLTPLLGVVGGIPDFSGITFSVNGSKFLIGHFINAVLSFLMTAGVIYFAVVLPMNRLNEKLKKTASKEEDSQICPECLASIPKKARRCMYCTSVVKK